ncbi:PREDICTED: tyrosine-protein kinase JAK2-like [Priapulus caudatus]|uniref:non-specific serine/threonine protein kinase n=1 Tax=Priapulus caudatus TaxID=37621 RepID=A0ABM1EU26_PRICU|nr:PREDICTED: tyrosine-protein kinase JAK2-like [Priapulus caudatus]
MTKFHCYVFAKILHNDTKSDAAEISYQADRNALSLQHHRAISLLFVYTRDDGSRCMVMEYGGERNLQQIINAHVTISCERRLMFARQVASALEYIHGEHIAHLDIKPANIAVSADDTCKLTDFGCSQKLGENLTATQDKTLQGTTIYRAPELLMGADVTPKADVYSFGMTLWQMKSGQQPYTGEDPHSVIYRVVRFHYRPMQCSDVAADYSEISYDALVASCWNKDAHSRPSAKCLVHSLSDTTDVHQYTITCSIDVFLLIVSKRDELKCGILQLRGFIKMKYTTFHSNANKEVQLLQKLGQGGFGYVHLAMYAGKKVAAKILHDDTKSDAAEISYQAERNALGLQHHRVISLLFVYTRDDGSRCMVMEYGGERNLQQIINAHVTISCEQRLMFARQVASALEYIHGEHIAHLDIKPANIVVSSDDTCKLTDFGCSQKLGENLTATQDKTLQGTTIYRAPELLMGADVTPKADVYSFGMTLWQMKSGQQPYTGEDPHSVIYRVVQFHYRPMQCSDVAADSSEISYDALVASCWNKDAHSRPSAKCLVHSLSDTTDVHQ